MTDDTRQTWRLRIRDVRADGAPGEVLGAGFVVAEGIGMTCAHVVGGMEECWIEAPDTPGETHRCAVRTIDPEWTLLASHPSTDIALITVPRHLPLAPLGPRERPRVGGELDALGYPARYASAGDRGQRTHVHVVGADETGTLLQVDGLQGFDGQIQPGYSGGPAVDLASGRVVGMVVSSDRLSAPTPPVPPGAPSETDESGRPTADPRVRAAAAAEARRRAEARDRYERQRREYARVAADQPALLKIAWIIPLETLADRWSPLTDLLPRGITVDPEFVGAVNDLSHHAYARALGRLNALVTLYPDEPDMYYYRALAGLSGQRPGGYAAPMVEAVERLLGEALRRNATAPDAHLRSLWALVQEDYYVIRGIPVDLGNLQSLQSAADRIEPRHADEILRHVPAVECPTWQRLLRMRGYQ
ncbi:MAG TPA: serine protease [Rugosimonospora sp.]|jgi:hypothetical protein